ncbi:hypothetical protein OJAV_G00014910 [Oryzias javanicus]|uniref:Uncharacterized protein n=1 Tax=Oryzias javanicus TaxID=123683 RepID=A0A3S2PSV5_ORYJA|nr:hypothetical protein OJAV_G00014910 [Oryzias javanicus]
MEPRRTQSQPDSAFSDPKRDAARGLERVDGSSATSNKVEEPDFVTCECPRGDCRSGACRRVTPFSAPVTSAP